MEIFHIPNRKVLSPTDFGADESQSSLSAAANTAAWNAMFARVRADIVANGYDSTRYTVDCAGIDFPTNGSINVSGLQAWDLVIQNGGIVSSATGKAALDLSGTRGYVLSRFRVEGVADSMPSVAFLAARTTSSFAFCDNAVYEDVTAEGYFSLAADYAYGQETTQRRHCRFWNSYVDGYSGIYEGYNTLTPTSDFQTLVTGATSYINAQWDNCDWRQLPQTSTRGIITAITKGAATTVTCAAGHPFTDGQEVVFALVGGMSQINSLGGTVSSATATTFVVNIDSSAFSNFTSGGFAVRKFTKPAIYWARGAQHYFNNCYAVAYGTDGIQVDFPDGNVPTHLLFDFLVEGAQTRSAIRLTPGASNRSMSNVDIKSYSTNCRTSFISVEDTAVVSLFGGSIKVGYHTVNSTLPMVDNVARIGFYNGFFVGYPQTAGVTPSTYADFRGINAPIDTSDFTLRKAKYEWSGNGAYTPTVGATSGSVTAASATGYFYRFLGDLAYISISVTVTTNGTGTGGLTVTLPSGVTANSDAFIHISGRNQNGGKSVMALAANTGGTLSIYNTGDGTYPITDGQTIRMSGIIRVS